MADYRDWCHSCGKEIVFGSHALDCKFWNDYKRRLREAEEAKTCAIEEIIRLTTERHKAELDRLRYEMNVTRRMLEELSARYDLFKEAAYDRKDGLAMLRQHEKDSN